MGENKKLVILPGWKSTPKKWEKACYFLEKEGIEPRVVCFPGFCEPLAKPFTLKDYAMWFLSQDYLSFSSVLLAHSFGARVLLYLISHVPDFSPRHLIFLNPAGFSSPRRVFSLPSFVKGFFPVKGVRSLVYRYLLRNPDALEKDPVLLRTYYNVVSCDLSDPLPSVPFPVTLIWGKEDRVTPPKNALGFLQRNPHANCFKVDHWAHSPHLRSPQELAKILGFVFRHYV